VRDPAAGRAGDRVFSRALGRCPSGQREQTVNLPADAYGGSNPSRPTARRSSSAVRAPRGRSTRRSGIEEIAPTRHRAKSRLVGQLGKCVGTLVWLGLLLIAQVAFTWRAPTSSRAPLGRVGRRRWSAAGVVRRGTSEQDESCSRAPAEYHGGMQYALKPSTRFPIPALADPLAPITFLDATSGVRFEFRDPRNSPVEWQQYLDGALASYRHYGVESALELDLIRDGESTSMFVVGRDWDGTIVGGVRFQGPLLEVDEAHVSSEFAGSTGEESVRALLAERISYGVVEFKAGWVRNGHVAQSALSDAVARTFVHGMEILRSRFGCCSAAVYATGRWETTGGVAMPGLEPIPYPTDEYQTTLLWWDADAIEQSATPRQWQAILAERSQMRRESIYQPDLVGIDAEFAEIDRELAGIGTELAGIDTEFAGIGTELAGIDMALVGAIS
jgi:hypothetical protein